MSTGNARQKRDLTISTLRQSGADVEDVDKTIKNATILGVKFLTCKKHATPTMARFLLLLTGLETAIIVALHKGWRSASN